MGQLTTRFELTLLFLVLSLLAFVVAVELDIVPSNSVLSGTIRGGLLLTIFFSLPWHAFEPLPVLQNSEESSKVIDAFGILVDGKPGEANKAQGTQTTDNNAYQDWLRR